MQVQRFNAMRQWERPSRRALPASSNRTDGRPVPPPVQPQSPAKDVSTGSNGHRRSHDRPHRDSRRPHCHRFGIREAAPH
jgi:hypothetical protein